MAYSFARVGAMVGMRVADYYPNGKVRFRGANLDGQMHGPWEFFRSDGSIMRSGSSRYDIAYSLAGGPDSGTLRPSSDIERHSRPGHADGHRLGVVVRHSITAWTSRCCC